MSKHEQREVLAIHLGTYLSDSVAKYNKHADKETQNKLLELVKKWMHENNWLNGKINQARKLLLQDMGLHEVSQKLQMH
ncbi:MAG: hypothetical protein NAG76_16080 [Candidatus Pristimantibacillus lignocellulolyticus]|uniref:Uncharacterized protein n=1 Tax=Candidatus Pristimantibacillus lignocellulolyticus TaxID=2994561 RepID=A0A9J6ZBF6_9BACL|nr:MAG: hypothetical protein NAG76_16080 [Candidatus Pristimantibacillus lignocellulolyticus]